MARSALRSLKLFVVLAALLGSASAGLFLTLFGGASNEKAPKLRTTESLESERAAEQAGYEVTMSPMGTVRFARPPRRVVTQDANYNDMLVAAGVGERLITTGYPNNFFEGFYAQIPGLAPGGGIDREQISYLSGTPGMQFDKELLYRLKADVHHIDPIQLAMRRGWSKADIDEITRNVGPFFANRYSRENIYPGQEPYEFYSVWGLGEKVAEVYRRGDYVRRLHAIGDALEARIRAKLPPLEERPRVGLIYYGRSRITPYSLGHGGFSQAHYVAVGARDAFEGHDLSTYGEGGGTGTALDLEGLLSIDPEVLIMPFAIYGAPGSGKGARAGYEALLKLRDDPLGKRLKAIQRDQVYPGGTPLQGPLFYLFQVEMAAKQIYPHIFGRYRDDQAYPPAECLFEREAVAQILREAHGR